MFGLTKSAPKLREEELLSKIKDLTLSVVELKRSRDTSAILMQYERVRSANLAKDTAILKREITTLNKALSKKNRSIQRLKELLKGVKVFHIKREAIDPKS